MRYRWPLWGYTHISLGPEVLTSGAAANTMKRLVPGSVALLLLLATALCTAAPSSSEHRLQRALALKQQGKLSEAVQAIGRLDTAAALTPVLGRLVFLRAKLSQRLKDIAAAKRDFRLIWHSWPRLADYAAWELAQYHAEHDDLSALQAIVTTLTRQYPFSRMLPEAQLVLAQTQRRLGQVTRARATLERFLEAHASHRSVPEALLLRAELAADSGEAVRAAETLRLLGEAYPRHALTSTAFRRSRQLLAEIPAAQHPQLSPTYLLTSIEPLARARRWQEVQARLRTLAELEPPHPLAPRILLTRGTVAWRRHRLQEARTLLRQFIRRYPQDPHLAQAHYVLAQLYRHRKQHASSDKHYRHVITHYGRSPWAAKSLLALARWHDKQQQHTTAAELYERLARHFPRDEKAAESLWQAAWLHYRLRRYGPAQRLWQRFETAFPHHALLPRALYWQARAAQQGGRQKTVFALYRRIVTAYPFHYYSVLAREQLRQASLPIPALTMRQETAGVREARSPVSLPASSAAQPSRPQFHLIRVRELQHLQLYTEARHEITRLTALLPDTHATRSFLASLFIDNQDYLGAFRHLNRIVRELDAATVRELSRHFWTGLYPKPFWTHVTAQAKVNDLNPYLVLSIMRQESAFNQRAVSSAGARGLLQLMPATARQVARQLHLPRFKRRMLFDPEANIALGTRYFASQLRRYQGNRVLALAAYNAGPRRADRWQQRWPKLPMDEFIERIPFRATRLYVKLVLRNLMTYEYLYTTVPAS